MKIAITGHSAGIGQAFAKILTDRGHEIIGLSKRDGNNIRNVPKIIEHILPCDLFINNAQAGYAQTELLYKVWESWQNVPNKHIWCISTMMTELPTNPDIKEQSDVEISLYRNQKVALEEAVTQLKFKSYSPQIILIRPGAVATQHYQNEPWPAANCQSWVNTVIDYITIADQRNMTISEISLTASKTPIGI